MKKIKVELIDTDGNAFALIAAVCKELRRAGLVDEEREFKKKAMECSSYDELLSHIGNTVDIT